MNLRLIVKKLLMSKCDRSNLELCSDLFWCSSAHLGAGVAHQSQVISKAWPSVVSLNGFM